MAIYLKRFGPTLQLAVPWLLAMCVYVFLKKKLTRILEERMVMNTKLTLTIEKEVMEIAKTYAKEKGQSLSEMVENYFKFVTVPRMQVKEKQLSSRVRKLRGIIKGDDNANYNQILAEELSKKYGV